VYPRLPTWYAVVAQALSLSIYLSISLSLSISLTHARYAVRGEQAVLRCAGSNDVRSCPHTHVVHTRARARSCPCVLKQQAVLRCA
jgi:hypothetical protein